MPSLFSFIWKIPRAVCLYKGLNQHTSSLLTSYSFNVPFLSMVDMLPWLWLQPNFHLRDNKDCALTPSPINTGVTVGAVWSVLFILLPERLQCCLLDAFRPESERVQLGGLKSCFYVLVWKAGKLLLSNLSGTIELSCDVYEQKWKSGMHPSPAGMSVCVSIAPMTLNLL